MGIKQINIWTCEVCGREVSDKKEVSMYDDLVIEPPGKWKYIGNPEKLACTECAPMAAKKAQQEGRQLATRILEETKNANDSASKTCGPDSNTWELQKIPQ